jgi:hypothetical protein
MVLALFLLMALRVGVPLLSVHPLRLNARRVRLGCALTYAWSPCGLTVKTPVALRTVTINRDFTYNLRKRLTVVAFRRLEFTHWQAAGSPGEQVTDIR